MGILFSLLIRRCVVVTKIAVKRMTLKKSLEGLNKKKTGGINR